MSLLCAVLVAGATPRQQEGTLHPEDSKSVLSTLDRTCPHKHGCSAESEDAMFYSVLGTEGPLGELARGRGVSSLNLDGSSLEEASCYNNCSASRGACVNGICSCKAQYEGWDCGSNPPLVADTGFIYVYDVDTEAGFEQYLEDAEGSSGGDANYQAEVRFLQRLMSDFSVRTLDPKQAKLFYTPTFTYYNVNNVCAGPKCLNLESIRRSASEFWGKNPEAPFGEDHVFFFVGDKGACGMPAGPIYVTHWGLTNTWHCMGHEGSQECEHTHKLAMSSRTTERKKAASAISKSEHEHEANTLSQARSRLATIFPWLAPHRAAAAAPATGDTDKGSALSRRESLDTTPVSPVLALDVEDSEHWQQGLCADARSIIVPSYGPMSPEGLNSSTSMAIREVADRHASQDSWPYEVSFAGGLGGAVKYEFSLGFENLCPGGGCYSQNVRQQVAKTFGNHSRFLIKDRESDEMIFGSARFCLTPSGDGFGVRLFKAVLIAGCVPLIIQPQVRQAFDELLPYEDFSVSLAYGDIPHLEQKLATIKPEQHRKMRKAMIANAHAFVFADNTHSSDGEGAPSSAYDYLVDSLRLRAGLRQGYSTDSALYADNRLSALANTLTALD
mmetsp:Transcript_2690/g.7402  ORF Transcript_2690/g.7402 Transcript_2690/m.7402 type:complete len:614 (-) Transcript_2690:218-2059(-)